MTPLVLDFTAPAEAEISAAIEFARAGGTSVLGDDAERFADRVALAFTETAAQLAEEIAANENGKPFAKPDEVASIRWSQPVYRLRVETAKKRRRGSSAGLWYAYYALHDKNRTGKPDTLYVLSFVHSAAHSLSIDGKTEESER